MKSKAKILSDPQLDAAVRWAVAVVLLMCVALAAYVVVAL